MMACSSSGSDESGSTKNPQTSQETQSLQPAPITTTSAEEPAQQVAKDSLEPTTIQPTSLPTSQVAIDTVPPTPQAAIDTVTSTPQAAIDTVTPTPQAAIDTVASTPTADTTDPEQISELIRQNPELCDTASGLMAELCIDRAKELIEADPAVCETATGMMAYLCQNMASESQAQTPDGHGSGSGTDSSNTDMIENPCDKVAEAFRSQCEASIRSDPNSPFYDGQSTGEGFVQDFDPNNIPKIAKANFTELDKFSRMSKLRSVVGHDYAFGTTEYDSDGLNCRSMKHYFVPVGVPRKNILYGSTPHTFEWMSIKFFAPADGVIQNVVRTNNQYGEEAQFAVASSDHPGYLFDFYHVKLLPGLDTGSVVSAGQQIGTLGDEESWGEIAVQAQISGTQKILLSFLQVATDEVLEEYKARGINTTSDVIITKEERDANPIGCDRNSEAGWFEGSGRGDTVTVEPFVIWVFESDDNWFFFD